MEFIKEYSELPLGLGSNDVPEDKKLATLYCYNVYYNALEDNASELVVTPDASGVYTSTSGLTYDRSKGSKLDGVFITDGMQGELIELISAIHVDEGNTISVDDIKSAIISCKSTFEDVYSRIYPGKNKMAESVIRNVIDDLDGDKIEVLFKVVTNYYAGKKDKRKISKEIDNMVLPVLNKKMSYSATVVFGDDIKSELEQNLAPFDFVKEDKLVLDKANNFLSFGKNSVVCTIKASSLRDLWERKKNRGLLAMNLRYYIAQPSVDNKITQAIENDSGDFWYMNNGIIIVCNDFSIDGDELKLSEFSIVNGGQTTRNIGETMDVDDKDFYLVCKVIRNDKPTARERTEFVAKVAEASNTQKAIKPKDIIANRVQQRRLKSLLEDNGIFCEIKRGEKPLPKEKYREQWQKTKNNELAQDLYAFVFSQPGPARNSVSKILENQAKYDAIFVNHGEYNFKFLRDIIFLEKAYKNYKKVVENDKNADATKRGLVKNGMFYALGIIGYLLKFVYTTTFIDVASQHMDDSDASFYKYCGELAFSNGFIDETISFQDFSSKAVKLFDYIVNNHMVSQFNIDKMATPELAYSNWLKNNQGYLRILKKINTNAFTNGVHVADGITKYFITSIDSDTYKKNDELLAKSIEISTGKVSVTQKQNDPEKDKGLYNDLWYFRMSKAYEKHVGDSTIFSDAQLEKLVLNKPTSKAAIGKFTSKIAAACYGDEILSIIEKYL